jgi:hypothetical protein
VVTVLAIGAVLLLAMVCVSWYGWVTLPADARVPIHFGVGYNNFVPKRVGLIMHPAIAALLLVIFTAVSHGNSGHGGKTTPEVITPLVMGLLLVVQVGAVRVARRRSGP